MIRTSEQPPVVMGAGTIGLTAACLLKQYHGQAFLLEKQAHSDWIQSKQNSTRVYAINPGAQRVLESVGVWPLLVNNQQISYYRKMRVWDEHTEWTLSAEIMNDPDFDHLGAVVREKDLHAALWSIVQADPAIHCVLPFQPKAWAREKQTLCLQGQVTDDRVETVTLETPLLLGADGSASWVRRYGQFPTLHYAYDQSSLTTLIQTSEPHCNTAYQYCETDGILACLPCPNPYHSAVIWSGQHMRMHPLYASSDAVFNQALTHRLAKHLGRVQICSEKNWFPLRTHHAQRYVQPHIALVGDAIHSMHPLAGQGLNLGLLDLGCLMRVLETTRSAQLFFAGALSQLRRYERERKPANALMLAAVHGLSIGLTHSATVFKRGRQVAFHAVERLNCLKQLMITQASGFPYAWF